MSLHHKTGDTPSNQLTFTFKKAAMANKIKLLGVEKVKLDYDLEQYKALNLELLRMINNPPNKESELVVGNKKLETELSHIGLLNSELIKLINSRNQVKEPHSSNQPCRELPTQSPEMMEKVRANGKKLSLGLHNTMGRKCSSNE